MTADMLETLNDDELRAVIARAQELLKIHDRGAQGACARRGAHACFHPWA